MEEPLMHAGGERDRKPRILHVTECYAGGVSRAIETIVRLVPGAHHGLLWRGDEKPEPTAGFESIEWLPSSPLTASLKIRRSAQQFQASVVHAHSSWAGAYARLIPSKTPIVYQPHCYKFDDPAVNRFARYAIRTAERAMTRRTDTTVSLSPHETALAAGLSNGMDVHSVPNVASVSPNAATPPTQYAPGNSIFMVGRLSPQKDPDFFIDVVRRVRSLRPGTHFRWLGDGDSASRTRLEEVGVDVTGWLDATALREALSTPGIYFHSASYEGFPLSVLDAAAFEHPIVAREISAFAGLPISTYATPADLAEALVDALNSGPRLVEAAAASRQLAESMTEEAQSAAWRLLYSRFTGE